MVNKNILSEAGSWVAAGMLGSDDAHRKVNLLVET